MPLIRIDIFRGRDERSVQAIADAVHKGVVEVLKIPERDRFQVVTQHDPGEIIALDAGLGFERSVTGVVIVQIFTQVGRSTDTKQQVYRALARRLGAVGVSGNDLFISYIENSAADWSFAEGRAQYVEGLLPVPGRHD
ncbi:tautomerase family protein [Nonomuraea aurantiaca]|uniref:tautomerase family protein n=1 Tax=Nonomuraea aurantiaca TaxID=2878562 RepID=UPI001CD986B5|nr:tautomerase family protein [Nonomuraea aurantiaca]MCA2226365.1 tautomerase family protein [Nonomuraea aurantiaca]